MPPTEALRLAGAQQDNPAYANPPVIPTSGVKLRDNPVPRIYDLKAEQHAALARSPSQKRKHPSIRGSGTRKIRTRGRDIYTTDTPMSRLGNQVASGEGMLEGDAWAVIDFDFDDITEFVPQPFKIPIEIFGNSHEWTPDALMRRSGVPTLIEVKPLKEVHPDPTIDPEAAAFAEEWFSAMRRAAEERDADFMLLTEVEVRTQPRFQNSQLMFRALNAHLPDWLILAAADSLLQLPRETTVSALRALMPAHQDTAVLVACLLDRQDYVRLDRREPFSPVSMMINRLGATR